MGSPLLKHLLALASALLLPLLPQSGSAAQPAAAAPGATISAPTAQQWADLAKLPDWSGVWTPDKNDQTGQEKSNPPPWNPKAAARIAAMQADDKAGHPHGIVTNCLPYGMPGLMLITHNALEFLFTPGRVTVLGEADGNRLRRIYTDGRPHPPDPDPSFHGHSVGQWEGDTLVVDTIGIIPEALMLISEAAGVPSNGDVHVVERIRVVSKDVLHDELTITAPHVLTKPWVTTRIYFRQRARKFEMIEGVCLQGLFLSEVDKNGDAVFVPMKITPEGAPLPP
jgi:hypothetical protein